MVSHYRSGHHKKISRDSHTAKEHEKRIILDLDPAHRREVILVALDEARLDPKRGDRTHRVERLCRDAARGGVRL